jgi:hypothetical protein
MTREEEIRRVLTEILYQGLLRIRSAAFQQDSATCYAEADHLHNLPRLIADFREDLLSFYCEAERASFLSAGGSPVSYLELWSQLDSLRASRPAANE